MPDISSVSTHLTAIDLAAPPAIHLSAPPAVSGSIGSNQSALPPPSSSSYAASSASSTDRPTVDSDGFTLDGGRRSSPTGPRKTIHGKKTVTDNCKLHPMARQPTAFVGRLHFDTSADDLSKFLKAAGVINPTCKRLEAINGRQFKTAAFMVSCDIFYDESIWPEGANCATGSSMAKRRLKIALIRRRAISIKVTLTQTMALNLLINCSI